MTLVAPASVRARLREGLALELAGYGGKGLVDETVDWAARLARGEPIDCAKARKMRGWFARHGVAVDESARRLRDPHSPAAVAWLLWGGDPAIPYRAAGWRDPVAPWLRDALAQFERKHNGPRQADLMRRFPHLPAALEDAKQRSPYPCLGLRRLDDPAEAQKGVRLVPSRRWVDDTPTDELLPGTSVIDLGDTRRAVELIADYEGRYVLLVGSHRSAGRGEDPGEDLLIMPWVLAVLDTHAG